MSNGAWRVELELSPERSDPVGDAARRALAHRGLEVGAAVRSARAYLLPGRLGREQVEAASVRLFADAVTETARILAPGETPADGASMLLIRRMAGVADPEGSSAARALRLVGIELAEGETVESYRAFRVAGAVDTAALVEAGSRALANPVIEEVSAGTAPLGLHPQPAARTGQRTEVPLLGADDARLAEVSREMSLALSVEEMQAIQAFYRGEEREPTDVELETLAQTWSEHCKHKTLTGPVRLRVTDEAGALLEEREYRNLLKQTVFEATQKLSPEWCWSVFKDNAGVVALTDEVGVAIKVETHNHPSALDPYGGAGTGIGGVIRDILGTGLGARPFAGTDVFCVGPAELTVEELPPGTMHPDRILEGVIAGVRDYGNRMGIPTVSGTVIRHPGYVANPLVYAGCIGEIPRDCVEKAARPGDAIVSIGGRTGRDGIHGATFSSEALHEESETVDAAAVQIGDPITEKKVLDVMLLARDRRLYSAVTDCGAGGFSSAVGEMGEECGAEVELSTAPLKYPGLSYWEIWISEAQERMVLAVPPEKLDDFLGLCDAHEVEATVLGTFTDTSRLVLRWHGEVVGDLPMDFLHGGVPQPQREAVLVRRELGDTPWPAEADPAALLTRALAHPDVVSKEWVVRQYDHEVQGGTVVKPYQGAEGRGPGDGSVVKPRLELDAGVAVGCGIAPRIAELDSWAGAACAIDEAVRNVVAAGGNPHRVALLDNFCWGDCRKPDRFGTLVAAAEACRDLALAYGAPFISGKDSLNNEYRVGEVEFPIPPTLLCTAIAPIADTARATTTPLRRPGDLLVLVGATRPADGGASVASDLLGLPASRPPRPDTAAAPAVFDAVHQILDAGLAVACHDLAEGGLAVAAAEMAIGSSGLGLRLDPRRAAAVGEAGPLGLLFAETPTRFLLEVAPRHLDEVGAILRALPWASVGEVTDDGLFHLALDADSPAPVPVEELARANGAAR
jgi:phosphoribosylformylglycinamidine synthase II